MALMKSDICIACAVFGWVSGVILAFAVIGFGMGMGMADAFMTSGGDAAVSGPVLAAIGGVAFVAALLVGLLPGRIRPGDAAAT